VRTTSSGAPTRRWRPGATGDARRFAQDAEVDAQLAASIARARRAEQALAQIDADVRALQEQAPPPR
jgi:hypothetical protein